MKKLILLLCFIAAGCASRGFDNIEYNYAVQSAVLSTRAIHQCEDMSPTYTEFVRSLNTQTMYLYEYEKHHDRNEYVMRGVTTLRQLVLDFMGKQNTQHSPTYCIHKLSEIQSASRALARALSGVGYLDMCDSDVMDRISLYQHSYDNKKINREEFAELVDDLSALSRADTAFCTVQQQEAIAAAIKTISAITSALK